MAHKVKCTICGKIFDRDHVQAVKTGARRYAHYSCFPEGELVPLEAVDEDLIILEEYVEKLLGNDYNPARVKKQIKDFKKQYDFSYSGMLKTLIWFYEIKENPIEKANGGIGIIPFVYKDALNYYYSLYLAQLANAEIENYKPIIKEITIQSPETYVRPPKMFNKGEDE